MIFICIQMIFVGTIIKVNLTHLRLNTDYGTIECITIIPSSSSSTRTLRYNYNIGADGVAATLSPAIITVGWPHWPERHRRYYLNARGNGLADKCQWFRIGRRRHSFCVYFGSGVFFKKNSFFFFLTFPSPLPPCPRVQKSRVRERCSARAPVWFSSRGDGFFAINLPPDGQKHTGTIIYRIPNCPKV